MILYLKSAFNIFKKAFLVITVYLIVISLFSYFIGRDKVSLSSRSDPIEQNRVEIYKVINDKKLNSTKEGKLTIALYRASMCGMMGEACTNNPKDADKNYEKSVFGFITKLIVMPYANPPASGIAWVSDGLQQAGLVPKTYAAEGIGFAAIKPFSNLWKIFRDLSYMLLVLVLIAIGFMVMFRMKINPQTVISVENALPKIIISLILITFSFAIAGFLIDLTYLVIALIISVLSNHNVYYDAGKYTNDYLTASPWKILTSLFPEFGLNNVGNALLLTLGTTFQYIVRGLAALISAVWLTPGFLDISFKIIDGVFKTSLGGFNLSFASGFAQAIVSVVIILIGAFLGFFWMPQFILGLLIAFTIIGLFFRLLFSLFNSYLKIFLYIIFSPFLLLFEAIPGKNVFSWWFKSLIAELINFPLLITLFLVSNIIAKMTASGVQMWQPPFLGQIDPNAYSVLLGMMMLLLIPDFMKLIREILGVKDLPIKFGLGTFFGGATAATGGAFGLIGQFGSLSLGITPIANLLGIKGTNIAEIAKNAADRFGSPKAPSAQGQADQNKVPGATSNA